MDSKVPIQPLTEEQKARIEANRQRAIALQQKAAGKEVLVSNNNEQLISKPVDQKNEEILCDQVIGTNICGTIMSSHDVKLYWDCFGERCCGSCRSLQGNDWDLISRTEVLSEYLIPVDSIQLMKFSTRPNPHNPQWTAMKLFLRRHARLKAYIRFGGAEQLEKEILRRKQVKFDKEFEQSNEIFSSSNFNTSSSSRLDYNGSSGYTRIDNLTANDEPNIGGKKKARLDEAKGDQSALYNDTNIDIYGSSGGGFLLPDNNDDDNDDNNDDVNEKEGRVSAIPEPLHLRTSTAKRGGSANKKAKHSARHVMADFASSLLASKGK